MFVRASCKRCHYFCLLYISLGIGKICFPTAQFVKFMEIENKSLICLGSVT